MADTGSRSSDPDDGLRAELEETTRRANAISARFDALHIATALFEDITDRSNVREKMTNAALLGASSVTVKCSRHVRVVMHHSDDSVFHHAVLAEVDASALERVDGMKLTQSSTLLEYMREHGIGPEHINHVRLHDADWLWETTESIGPPLETAIPIPVTRSSPVVGPVLGAIQDAAHWLRPPPDYSDWCVADGDADTIHSRPEGWTTVNGVWKRLIQDAPNADRPYAYTVTLGGDTLKRVCTHVEDMIVKNFGVKCATSKTRFEFVLSWSKDSTDGE